nr:dihydrofolate reductase family protein [uncultured Lacibacter sp.]
MRKVILSLAVSLDGFIEGPNGETDWMVFSEETGKALEEFLDEIDTILYGRLSYERWGTYNPPEDAPVFEKNFYNRTNKMKKYVFSTSKNSFEGNPTVVNAHLSACINKLKQENGKHIWLYGGSSLITSFVNLNLIDEFRIAVIPIILGDGKPLFSEIKNRVHLKLLKINSGISGVAELIYENVKH